MNKGKVTVHRNAIEQFLMSAKDFIKAYRKKIVIAATSFFVLFVLIVSFAVYSEIKEENDILAYEKIIKEFAEKSLDKEKKEKALEEATKQLIALTDSSISGYINENGYYIVAGLYFSEKKYKKAKEFYMKYVDDSSSIFTPLALRQAALCDEWNKNYDSALKIYEQLADDYADSPFADQNLYDLGRMFQKKGNSDKAKEYYNKLITAHPNSVYLKNVKKRLFALKSDNK